MDYARLLQSILDIGQAMLECGSEVSRAEDSIYRMCKCYGMPRCDVFGLPNNIQVTVETVDGQILTQVRHVRAGENNFDRLDYLNDLSRYIVNHEPEPAEIRERFEKVMARPPLSFWTRMVASMVAAGGFTIFFSGTMRDGAVSAATAALYVAVVRLFLHSEDNPFIFNFIAALLMGVCAVGAVHFGLGDRAGTIIVGDIMLLIGGVGLTNGMRDLLKTDVISGTLRVINALMGAAAIAAGVTVAMMIGGLL